MAHCRLVFGNFVMRKVTIFSQNQSFCQRRVGGIRVVLIRGVSAIESADKKEKKETTIQTKIINNN